MQYNIYITYIYNMYNMYIWYNIYLYKGKKDTPGLAHRFPEPPDFLDALYGAFSCAIANSTSSRNMAL